MADAEVCAAAPETWGKQFCASKRAQASSLQKHWFSILRIPCTSALTSTVVGVWSSPHLRHELLAEPVRWLQGEQTQVANINQTP